MTEPTEDFLKFIKKAVTEDVRHAYYKKCKEHFDEMAVHVYGKKPEALLNRVRPREDDSIKQYRLESYEPTTKAICGKAISIANKIFNQKLYSIRFGSEEGRLGAYQKELQEYTSENYPKFNSVMGYLSKYAFKKMLSDPNGILVVQPYDYNVKPNERVKPYVSCYHSGDIWHIDSEYALIFLNKEEESQRRVYFFQKVDKLSIINFELSSTNGKDYVYLERSSYDHNFGEMPLWFLGGDYSDKQEGIYQSFFYDAVPFWNMAIADESDVIGAYRNHLHPKLWEFVEDCDYIEDNKYPCSGGKVLNPAGNYNCPSCKGSGKRTPKSPYESYQVSSEKFKGGDGVVQVSVPFGYVTVPEGPTKMLEERSKYNLMRGLEALNMDVVTNIGENQSGVAKAYDRTELFDFLQKIADQVFDVHAKNIYYYFTKYMFGVEVPNPELLSKIEPEISKPTEFDVFSIGALTQQLKDAKEASLNPSFTKTLQIEIQNKKFGTHPELLERLNLTTILDPLAEVSDEEINLKLQRGSVSKQSVVIHDNIEQFINMAFGEGDFDDLDYEEQMKVLTKYADKFIADNKSKIDTTLLDATGGTQQQGREDSQGQRNQDNESDE